MSEVMLVLKRNAKTDPPQHQGFVWTDEGKARYLNGLWLDYGIPIDPHWWLDVRPSDDEPLTVGVLKRILNAARRGHIASTDDLARLRVALEALTRKDDT